MQLVIKHFTDINFSRMFWTCIFIVQTQVIYKKTLVLSTSQNEISVPLWL